MPATGYSIFPLGDHALVLELTGPIDPALNRRLQAARTRLLDLALPGILDVLAAYTALTVYYDPLALLPAAGPRRPVYSWLESLIARAYDEAAGGEVGEPAGRLHRIPVRYGGYDLPAVAVALGCTEAEVVSLHTASDYRVYLIGFLPGFPYLGLLPEQLTLPRKPQPQPVIAGSVAIAGRQTGIYTVDSPGGWHVLGHTALRLFDPAATPPVLLQPGDTVRFVDAD